MGEQDLERAAKDFQSFSFDAIKAGDETDISRASLQKFISEQPKWLVRFGVPDADDLFRRMDRNRDAAISSDEFGAWLQRYAEAARADGPICKCCPRVTGGADFCCLMCSSSAG